MKKNLSVLAILLFAGTYCFGQTNNLPPTGNVGIATGSTTPGAKLSFNNMNDGSNGADGITWYNVTPTDYGIHRTAGTWVTPNYQQLRLGWRTGIILDPGAQFGKSYVDVQGGGLRVTTGNLGVGTATPTEKLHVMAEGLLRPTFESITSVKWLRTNMDFKRSRGTLALKLPVEYRDKLGSIYFWGHDGASYLEASEFGGTTEAVTAGAISAGLYFSTTDGQNSVNNAPKVRMYITASGNVLISPKIDAYGDLVPGAEVGDGKLQVSGLIRAKEIKVETANWPDFVFVKDYKLPTLQETENHIREKGHLPGIPSAKEAEANGVQLGEMNKKLLQKVEELTLHLINQEKRLAKQEEQIRILNQTKLISDQNHK